MKQVRLLSPPAEVQDFILEGRPELVEGVGGRPILADSGQVGPLEDLHDARARKPMLLGSIDAAGAFLRGDERDDPALPLELAHERLDLALRALVQLVDAVEEHDDATAIIGQLAQDLAQFRGREGRPRRVAGRGVSSRR